mmetsp:Transcript_31690/g.69814  ORF Transcript_31690/g.69814 Transcript_31690/m.69814 type:complete len:310 (+) Transcript_31690:527-1456(+)
MSAPELNAAITTILRDAAQQTLPTAGGCSPRLPPTHAHAPARSILEGTFNDPWRLKVNGAKTEYINLSPQGFRPEQQGSAMKKLGSLLPDAADISSRVGRATQAFHTMWKIWLNTGRIRLRTRIRLYDACIRPILTYNTGTLGVAAGRLEAFDVAHRRHLKHICRIYWPTKISTERLYAITKSSRVTEDIHKLRWNLFGHVLRLGHQRPTIPAFRAMTMFFSTPPAAGRRPTRTTLPTTLHNDLRLIGESLSTLEDLQDLQRTALVPAARRGAPSPWDALSSSSPHPHPSQTSADPRPPRRTTKTTAPR